MEISDLTPLQFENLVFDLLQAAGIRRLVWRTPGPDGGRDLEGFVTSVDFSGYFRTEKWYVECKRYNTSIDWPTVWNKLAYADSNKANFLLIVTNNNPSPSCETEISKWNSSEKRPPVRFWRGYELKQILSNYPAVSAKHGLLESGAEAELGMRDVIFSLMKSVQASYTAYALDQEISSFLEANATLCELLSARLDQIKSYGRVVRSVNCKSAPDFDWLNWDGPTQDWEEISIRALVTALRHITSSEGINVAANENHLQIHFVHPRGRITPAAQKALAEVAFWCDLEIGDLSDNGTHISARKI